MARRIRYWREMAGLSKAELARELGVHPSNITFWERERGGTSPTWRNLQALARACGVELRTFFAPLPGQARE